MSPKTILISLDGATPSLLDQYLSNGVLNPTEGLGRLKSQGIVAQQNQTVTPSLTAPAHIAIGTGSTAARNDINANSFHLVTSPFSQNISGFAAPIGGYSVSIDGPVDSAENTANPLWLALQDSGKKVVAATFPGADGLDIRVPGVPDSPIIQPASERTVDYTVPFGTFGGVAAQGFNLTAADFSPAPSTTTDQFTNANQVSFSPVLQKTTPLDSFTVGGANYSIQVAALDTTNDNSINYDTLAFFDANQGIQPGPFSLPSTGPAYVRASDKTSSPFYLEGSSNKAGTSFYVSNLAPDLSTVNIARYSANFIPRNPAVLADVDDINNNVGFWAPQPDYRIPEQLSPGFTNFPDAELEAIYQDQVRTFVDYQTRVALRGISQNPDADLVMTYIEQPDGSSHQFLLTDPRQATDFRDPNTIGAGQDQEKIERYQTYVETAYQTVNNTVERIIDEVGTDSEGKPNSNIIVVSDHGFAPFHTAVNINNFLQDRGFDNTKVRAVTSGPAVNIYINLQGREPNGTVSPEEYVTLQQQVTDALTEFVDTNPNYTSGSVPIFDKIYSRPVPGDLNDPSFGLGTNEFIGQDSGDVFALLDVGYNFDGTQNPVVQRLGDADSGTPVLSVPNFYGAHGYDPTLPEMSAIFLAAGPDIGEGTLDQVRNIDVAPTIEHLLGVKPDPTVQGSPINLLNTLNGSNGQNTFSLSRGNGAYIITDFGGVGTGTEPSTAAIAEVDTLKFEGAGLTAENMLLTQSGSDLLIGFEGIQDIEVRLKDFDLEDLDNLQQSTGASVDIGNILFEGQTEIEDSFDVFNTNQQSSSVFNQKVTFLNDLDNYIQGRNGSNKVINAQGGNDELEGLSDNILRGGSGNDVLDTSAGTGNNRLYGDEDKDILFAGVNDQLFGNEGDDILFAGKGGNTLTGGDGQDQFWIAAAETPSSANTITDFQSGADVIGIGGLTGVTGIGNLSITQSGADTLINALGKDLAILKGIESNSLDSSSFVFA